MAVGGVPIKVLLATPAFVAAGKRRVRHEYLTGACVGRHRLAALVVVVGKRLKLPIGQLPLVVPFLEPAHDKVEGFDLVAPVLRRPATGAGSVRVEGGLTNRTRLQGRRTGVHRGHLGTQKKRDNRASRPRF